MLTDARPCSAGNLTPAEDDQDDPFRTLSLIAIAALTLSACGMSEGIDADSDEGVFTITHTTKGTVYWQ